VGLITSDSFGRFSIPIMEGLEEHLSDSRISVFMCNGADDPEREARHVDALLGKRVDGIVVTGRRADPRRRLDVGGTAIPVLYVYSQSEEPGAFGLVPDDEGGAAVAVEHLVKLGRKRIAHITGPERFEAVRLRRDGYRKTLKRHGLSEPRNGYLAGPWSEEWGREAVGRLFGSSRAAPDALFCGNDQIARGAADELRARGIAVPDSVSIVGFDNWEIVAQATRPPLTTIDMNLKELGREAGRRLIDMIDGKRLRGVHRLPCSIIVRESCGAGKT
jgi:LacI family transcriptional regulator